MYNHYCLTSFLHRNESHMRKNLSLHWVHPCEMFWRLCVICCQFSSSKSRHYSSAIFVVPTPVLLQKPWSCVPTARMVITLWIAVAIQIQRIRMLKGDIQWSKIKPSRARDITITNFRRQRSPNPKSNIRNRSL